ncbi:bifunctional 3-(3-hydroxy-phenyl)propionate/3-hydroxycinnamic acid hydroxylase [Corynebacterium lubricantis]|uniref:bifunctional 3-(3-hydroxy-phenyl)propionate/3-hydroxycinnamic acid hydroxylase MhpA n=1 Tax=Corynebacterium lubricantis TaxID=541095 RepID=UPI00039C927B|nr:bifunctional 3-(3-hydroxy-phenyl)propionate/3-hydroxycinnamic acid hydroxylase [Corynebacterium lubricantis]
MAETIETDVLIAGAGPTGLVLSNLLGARGVKVVLVDKRAQLIDYPRGVGLDDESYRTIQAMGLLDEIEPYTLPHHVMRIVNGRGEVIMTNDPQGEPFGFPRKFGFLQPLVDQVVYEGLDRYPNVTASFGRELASIVDHGTGVTATLNHVTGEEGENRTGEVITVNARFLIGCEGGRSLTRKWMGVDFEGVSPSTRWVVVDVRNDPLGIPNVYLGADPERPYVSIGLPHGVRRFEFMLFDDEPNERVEDDAFVTELLNQHLPEGIELDIIRRRVFTHHGRVASDFRKGNVMVAGDAAHLMPVWMGQGFNSGVRDATNLAWKIDAVLKGRATDSLLDTYSQERLEHAKAMVDLSLTMGNVIKPTDKKVAFARDLGARAMNLSPQVRDYFSDMRFKPMPRYSRGVVVDHETLTAGKADRKISQSKIPRLVPLRNALRKDSVVGTQFVQPWVTFLGDKVRLDDALGNDFAILSWGLDPAKLLSVESRDEIDALGIELICAVSPNQVSWAEEQCASTGTRVVADDSGALKTWFDVTSVGSVILRPDRFIASACLNGNLQKAFEAVVRAGHFVASQSGTSAVEEKN